MFGGGAFVIAEDTTFTIYRGSLFYDTTGVDQWIAVNVGISNNTCGILSLGVEKNRPTAARWTSPLRIVMRTCFLAANFCRCSTRVLRSYLWLTAHPSTTCELGRLTERLQHHTMVIQVVQKLGRPVECIEEPAAYAEKFMAQLNRRSNNSATQNTLKPYEARICYRHTKKKNQMFRISLDNFFIKASEHGFVGRLIANARACALGATFKSIKHSSWAQLCTQRNGERRNVWSGPFAEYKRRIRCLLNIARWRVLLKEKIIFVGCFSNAEKDLRTHKAVSIRSISINDAAYRLGGKAPELHAKLTRGHPRSVDLE